MAVEADFHRVEFYLGDPHAIYRELRRRDPVHWHALPDGSGMWMLSRWEDIRSVSRQPGLFSTAHGVLLKWAAI